MPSYEVVVLLDGPDELAVRKNVYDALQNQNALTAIEVYKVEEIPDE